MSRGRFEPGAVCIIVGEPRGYECNIGATLTLVELIYGTNVSGEPISNWTFTSASCPLLTAVGLNGRPDLYGTDSTPFSAGPGVCVPAYAPRQLLPIGGLGPEEEDGAAKPLVVEMANGSTLTFAD